jgi:hypothetical protein
MMRVLLVGFFVMHTLAAENTDLPTWLGSVNGALTQYAKPLEALGYITVQDLQDLKHEFQVSEVFDQLAMKKPHRKVFLKGWRAFKGSTQASPGTNVCEGSAQTEADRAADAKLVKEASAYVGAQRLSRSVQELVEGTHCEVTSKLLGRFNLSTFYSDYYEKKWLLLTGRESPGKRKGLPVDSVQREDILATLLRNQNSNDQSAPLMYAEDFALSKMEAPQESMYYQPDDYTTYDSDGEPNVMELSRNIEEVMEDGYSLIVHR